MKTQIFHKKTKLEFKKKDKIRLEYNILIFILYVIFNKTIIVERNKLKYFEYNNRILDIKN